MAPRHLNLLSRVMDAQDLKVKWILDLELKWSHLQVARKIYFWLRIQMQIHY